MWILVIAFWAADGYHQAVYMEHGKPVLYRYEQTCNIAKHTVSTQGINVLQKECVPYKQFYEA